MVLSHLLKLHENSSHVKLLLDDVTRYDKFLAHRLEAAVASFLQTVAEAAAHFGHEVVLLDPQIDKPIKRSGSLTGTMASLGVLMGYVFRRSKGRAQLST